MVGDTEIDRLIDTDHQAELDKLLSFRPKLNELKQTGERQGSSIVVLLMMVSNAVKLF